MKKYYSDEIKNGEIGGAWGKYGGQLDKAKERGGIYDQQDATNSHLQQF
jgi:hypothetical protein